MCSIRRLIIQVCLASNGLVQKKVKPKCVMKVKKVMFAVVDSQGAKVSFGLWILKVKEPTQLQLSPFFVWLPDYEGGTF